MTSDTTQRNRRIQAALALRGLSVNEAASRCGVTHTHLRAVLLGERKPSAQLDAAMLREIGVDALAFIDGRTNVLRAS